MKRLLLSVLLAAPLALAGTAYGATAVSVFGLTAPVPTACSLSATPVEFLAYTGATNVDGIGTVTVNCRSGISYNVTLDGGGNYLSPNRRLTSGSEYIPYELYSNSARTTEWGDAGITHPAAAVSGTGSGATQSYAVYGRLFSGSFVGPGTYTDVVSVTLNY